MHLSRALITKAPNNSFRASRSERKLELGGLTLGKLLLATLAVFAPAQPLLITVGILILADLITGMMAARKRGEAITSAAMRRSVTKLFIYNVVILTGLLMEKYVLRDIIPVMKLCGSVIGLVEFKSLLENCESILGEKIFEAILKRLGSKNDQK